MRFTKHDGRNKKEEGREGRMRKLRHHGSVRLTTERPYVWKGLRKDGRDSAVWEPLDVRVREKIKGGGVRIGPGKERRTWEAIDRPRGIDTK